jgi:hypothetical protein
LTKRRWAKCGKHVKKPWWETNLHAQYIKIKQKDGHLGPYPRILNPGDVQHMIFQGNDVGPFWLSEREREMNNITINLAIIQCSSKHENG